MRTVGLVVAGTVAALVLAPSAAAEHQFEFPANSLNPLIGLTGVDAPANLPAQHNREPSLRPVPRADCGPLSRPIEGLQGRVPPEALKAAEGAQGYTCNTRLIGRVDTRGGWKVWRFVDRAGNECAYYDASDPHLLAAQVPGPRSGVVVLDMSDPAKPVQTDLLQTLPMQMPHESLNLNKRRGLLAAEMGSAGTAPGLLSIYDLSEDCRNPVHHSTTLAARFGHESGWSPDGRTYWMGGATGLAAIDVTDPARPWKVWEGALFVHGLSVSRSGERLYVADPINGHLAILDSSEVQARVGNPEMREVSRLTWDTVSIPQNTAPMTIDGKPYVLEFDEFGFRFTGFPQDSHQVGAARIVDISDERKPRVVSNLRLEVNQRDQHRRFGGDTGAFNFVQGYSAHYCSIPRPDDPGIVACSFIASGLRIFDIRNPRRPREVAYYVAPPEASETTLGPAANFAVSKPAFAPGRREVWYTDINSGFHALRLSRRAWDPSAGGGPRERPARVLARPSSTEGARPSGRVVPAVGTLDTAYDEQLGRQIDLICSLGLLGR